MGSQISRVCFIYAYVSVVACVTLQLRLFVFNIAMFCRQVNKNFSIKEVICWI